MSGPESIEARFDIDLAVILRTLAAHERALIDLSQNPKAIADRARNTTEDAQ